jgi:5-methylcytosine-specific restriction enzyme B
VHRALIAMHEWWLSAQDQGGKHLMPLLALLENSAGVRESVQFEESNDFDFWNRHFKVIEDDSKPYLMPLILQSVVESYPHSNPATLRKNRWEKWGLGKSTVDDDGNTHWSLDPKYASVFKSKALTKGGRAFRVPVVDAACLLLRGETFEDDATARSLEDRFRERFPQRNEDYDAIFRFVDEQPESIFTDASPTEAEYASLMRSVVQEDAKPLELNIAPATDSALSDDDPVLVRVKELLRLGSSGMIFRGAPGTGKTWYARRVAEKLVADSTHHVIRVQFHPSYGYEDFVEGFRPDAGHAGGFSVVDKHFLNACRLAESTEGYVVLLIDEINRGDPSRIFGEVLTYIERDYRGQDFRLPYSSAVRKIPANLLIFGTMNPFDRSITQLDAAFMRRFDHIDIAPSGEVVSRFLEDTEGFNASQIECIRTWFDDMQRILAPYGIGHSYFKDIRKIDDIALIWRYRMQPACEALLEFDPPKRASAAKSFDGMLAKILGMDALAAGESEAEEP